MLSTGELFSSLTRRGERLRPGALLISFTTALQTLWFVVVYKRRFTMSWGPATVFIHRKLSAAEHAARLEGELTSLYDDDQAIAIPDFQTTLSEDMDSMDVQLSEQLSDIKSNASDPR